MAAGGGFGLVVKVVTGTAATLTAIANVVDADFPEMENVLAEITAHDSTGGFQEFIASGKVNLGTFDVEMVWDVAEVTHAQLVTLEASGAASGWSIEDPDGDEVLAFNAIVVKLARENRQDGARMCTATIQPTGSVTIT